MTASRHFPLLPLSWSEETGYLPSAGNQDKLFYRILKNQKKTHPRLLFIIHGIGEQSDRFLHFPHYLHSSFDVIALVDLPGHGQSSGTRGHIESFDEYSQAALTGFNFVCQRFPEIKSYHWLGCSMGGLITLRTMLQFPDLPLRSVIVAEPQLGIAVEVPVLKEFFASLLEPLIGKIPLKNEIDAQILSHDKDVQAEYKSNALNHAFVSPRLYVQMKRELARLASYSGDFPYNLLVLVPLADQIVDWKKTLDFYGKLQLKKGCEKSLNTFPHFYHELFNEVHKERPFTALEGWIQKIDEQKLLTR